MLSSELCGVACWMGCTCGIDTGVRAGDLGIVIVGGMGVGGFTTIDALDNGDSSISGRVALKADSAEGDIALMRPSCERKDGLRGGRGGKTLEIVDSEGDGGRVGRGVGGNECSDGIIPGEIGPGVGGGKSGSGGDEDVPG